MEINGKVHCFFEQEEWRDIKGFERLYQVSNMGRVRSLSRIVRAGKNKQRRTNGKVLTPWKTKHGYLHVGLGRGERESVHRLVAMTFIPNPKNYPDVNHKDENKANNVVSNLEWCNHSYNALYGTCQERLRKHKNTPVEMVDKTTHEVLAVFESMKVAMRETGVNKVTISMVCRGKRKIGGGYIWRYAAKFI